ncbi:MAG: hypothetical protein WC758_00985 [Candidatus Woesearchaeota archaeon]
MDALIAGTIFTLTFVLLLSFMLKSPYSVDAKYYIGGYSDYVTNTKMSQFKNNYAFIYYDAHEPNPDLSVYNKVSLLVNKGNTSLANSFVKNFTSFIIPDHVGVEYRIDNFVVYSRYENRKNDSAIAISTSILTFVMDENNNIYGPNVTKLTVWV